MTFSMYQMQESQIVDLFYELMRWTDVLANGMFIFTSGCEGKNVKKDRLAEQFEKAFRLFGDVFAGFDGYKINSVVYSQTTLKKYQNDFRRLNPVYTFGWDVDSSFGGSIDYSEYFRRLFPFGRPDNEKFIENIQSVFLEPNRKHIGLHRNADFDARFSVKQYKSHPEAYFGEGEISFGAFCLGDSLDRMADQFLKFAISLAEKYIHLNIHVMLQPREYLDIRSPYMRYFGKNVINDGSHKVYDAAPEEWYKNYYLCGVEWCNVLSPLTSKLLTIIASNAEDDIVIGKTKGGGMIIRVNKPISHYDIEDAYAMKRVLLPALYPGTGTVSLRALFPFVGHFPVYAHCPRSNWEIVPVSKHEISIVGSDIVYHTGRGRTGDGLREP